MAERTSGRSEKERLIAEIEASRGALSRDLHSLARSADIPSRLARSIRSVPGKVATSSMFLGLVSSLLLGSRARPARHRKHTSEAIWKRILAFVKSKQEATPPAGRPPESKAPPLAETLQTVAKALQKALK